MCIFFCGGVLQFGVLEELGERGGCSDLGLTALLILSRILGGDDEGVFDTKRGYASVSSMSRVQDVGSWHASSTLHG